jgi:hypothetical protein
VNKKEAKKTLIYLARAVETPVAHEQKFFASFFQKRSACFLPKRPPWAGIPKSVIIPM